MKENFGTAERMWASANGKLYRGWKEKKDKIVQYRLGFLFKQFAAIYLISPLTSNKSWHSRPVFRADSVGAVLGHGFEAPSSPPGHVAPKPLDIWFTLASHPGHTMEESASFTGCCRCGSPRMAPGDTAATGKAGGTLAWPDSSSCCSPPWHLPSFSIQCSSSPFSEVVVPLWESLLHVHKG